MSVQHPNRFGSCRTLSRDTFASPSVVSTKPQQTTKIDGGENMRTPSLPLTFSNPFSWNSCLAIISSSRIKSSRSWILSIACVSLPVRVYAWQPRQQQQSQNTRKSRCEGGSTWGKRPSIFRAVQTNPTNVCTCTHTFHP